MSKSIFAKAAAIVCSAATLCALSISASALTSNDPLGEGADVYAADITAGVANIIGARITVTTAELKAAAEAGEDFVVEYPVYLINNPGFAGSGVNITYNEALTCVRNANGKPVTTYGPAQDGLTPNPSHNPNRPLVGCGAIAVEDEYDNGKMFAFQFVVPSDATAGTVYDMKIDVTQFVDYTTAAVPFATVDGWITVEGPADTTTTPAPVVTTTTEAQTTTAADDGTTTTGDGTTTTGNGTTTTAQGGATTTTKPGSNSGNGNGNSNGVQTGDAGVGVAAAALLLAAGTAAVATKKKKD